MTQSTTLKSFRRVLAAGTASLAMLALVPGVAHAGPPAGAQAFQQSVDALVNAYVEKHNLPGMTVAVSKHDRLIHTKGYGFALYDGGTKLPMQAAMRARIGSSSKAAITGPAAYGLLQEHGIDPATTPLYGPDGFFGGKFDADIQIRIDALTPDSLDQLAGQSVDWEGWYSQITIQHLFDHASGFNGSGDGAGAAEMFGVAEEDLTYELIHRHFLRTRTLLFEPGTDSEYSNHGFGLFTLVIEQLAGTPYYQAVRDGYLSTMNLQNRIRPEFSRPDSCDAHNHKHGEGDINSLSTDNLPAPVPFAFEQYGLGLAAGGWRASAQDLAWVMTSLESRYAWEEIDSMGWGSNSKGKLSHNGKLSGGTSVVQMFPEGYTSSGKDLSGVKVALVTNIRTKDGSLGTLANQISLLVPAHEVEADYNLWRSALGSYSCTTVEKITSLSR